MFSYKPLAEGHVRLISFTDSSGLNCIIENHALEDGLDYIALSYTWGKAPCQQGRLDDEIHQITLDNHTITVQQNLHDALKQFGKPAHDSGSKFWVDFVCIDQANAMEVSQQVQLMGDIYGKARSIYAWLGLPSDNEQTISALLLMGSFCEHIRNHLPANNDLLAVMESIDTDSVGFPAPDRLDYIEAWHGIAELFARQYWSRTWIMQEVTTPGDIWFYCGNHKFNDEAFAAAVMFGGVFVDSPRFPRHLSKAVDPESNAYRVSLARSSRIRDRNPSLLLLLLASRNTHCLDARDKVFAPLGRARGVVEQTRPCLRVDYTRSVTEVYIDVMKHMFHQNKLSILSHVYIPALEASHPSLHSSFEPAVPSWVVDWRQATICRPIDLTDQDGGRYQCFDVWSGVVEASTVLEVQGAELLISGSILGSIATVTSIWDDDERWYDLLIGWKSSLQGSIVDSLDETFNRVLLGDVREAIIDNVARYIRERPPAYQTSEQNHSAGDNGSLENEGKHSVRQDDDSSGTVLDLQSRGAGISAKSKPIIVVLSRREVTNGGKLVLEELRSATVVKWHKDVLLLGPTMTFEEIRDLVLLRSRAKDLLPVHSDGELTPLISISTNVKKFSSDVVLLDDGSWEAGRELLLTREDTTLRFDIPTLEKCAESAQGTKNGKKSCVVQ